MRRRRSAGTAPRQRRGWARTLLRLLVLLFVGFYAACALLLLAYRWLSPPLTTVQIQRCLASLFARETHCGRHSFVPLAAISPHLPRAVVAAEDARFYQHRGVDWEVLRELAQSTLERRRLGRGGSTITQQLVKNLFLTTHYSLIRKGLELPLALLADLLLSKQRQLELYLNVVEWGPGVFGAERAARYHYRISPGKLSRAQAARLAAVLPAPLRRTPERMHRYGDLILRRMR